MALSPFTSSARDFNQSFSAMKRITLITLVGAFLLNGLLVYYILSKDEQSAKRVYVVTDNGTFAAVRQEHRQVSVYEAKNHVKTFLTTMFAHDANNYRSHVENALHLIDKVGGQRIVNDFNKGQVYENYVRLGTYTTLQIDSVVMNMGARPVSGRAYAQQTIYLGDQQKAFPIAIQFELTETYRSDQNPYGLLIQHFDYIAYHPIVSTPKVTLPRNAFSVIDPIYQL